MKKTVGIMQPYFLPYLGYWQHIFSTDVFVLYDDVNYIKKGWINRNSILINGKKYLFTIPLIKISQNKKINEIYIAGNECKAELWKNIYYAYHRSPMWNDVEELVKGIILYGDNHLASYIKNSICQIKDYLGIDTRLIMSSEMKKNEEKKGQDRIISLCKELSAEIYINPSGGGNLYDDSQFNMNGIELRFISPEFPQYRQNSKEFVPGLSIIDLLFCVEKENIIEMLKKYKLVEKRELQ